MNHRLLITISTIIIILFGTYIAVRWAQGYRINLQEQTVEGNGLLVANSDPKGASVYINDELNTATDDTLHLIPGQYSVRLEKEGYSNWQKTLKLEKELVTQTNAKLFPSVPNLRALTVNSAIDLKPSPDGHKIAYKIASNSAKDKNGIWIFQMSNNPLNFGSNSNQVIQDTDDLKFSQSQIFWNPNSNQIISYFNENKIYILEAFKKNDNINLLNRSFELEPLIAEWQKELYTNYNNKIKKLPKKIQEIATTSATLTYFSPNEEMIMYTATKSASIPKNIIPTVIATNSQPENRNLSPGNTYVYDIKEDKNFLIVENALDANQLEESVTMFKLPKFSLNKPQKNERGLIYTNKTQNKKLIDLLTSISLHYSPVYSYNKLQWFPSSRHLIKVDKGVISILEYDSTNNVTIYSGTFSENFAYPWPNGDKMIILTSLTMDPSVAKNLYGLSLE